MTDTNQEADSGFDDPGDYNPESIDYEAQDNDSNQDAEYPSDDASNEQAYDPGYVEPTTQSIGQPSRSPAASQSPVASHSPIASRSSITAHPPSATRSPVSTKQYDPMETQEGPPIQVANNDNAAYKSPPADVNDNHAMPPLPQPITDPPQDQSALPKSVDLQALLAGLVPARSKVSTNSPPQPREKPPPQPQQLYPLTSGLPPPAMNLPPDIMYQLQTLTSPPPPPTFQAPPSQQQQAPPQQQPGPVDIQPEDLALTPQEEHLYEKFLQNEREVVQNAKWDEFAPGSRMFIGNLPSDRIGKKDIFRLFYPYGRLAQISIKQAYGFVQFYEKADCDTAIRAQQGTILTGRKIRIFPVPKTFSYV